MKKDEKNKIIMNDIKNIKKEKFRNVFFNSIKVSLKSMFSNNEDTLEEVDMNDVKKFEAVIKAVHEREEERNSYIESMRADGKLQDLNKNRDQSRTAVKRDRADD